MTAISKAFYFSSKPDQFTSYARSKEQVLQQGLKEVKEAETNFRHLCHKAGLKYCIKLRSNILEQLGIPESEFQKRKNEQEIHRINSEIKLKETSGKKSKFLERKGCEWLSLIVSPSLKQPLTRQLTDLPLQIMAKSSLFRVRSHHSLKSSNV